MYGAVYLVFPDSPIRRPIVLNLYGEVDVYCLAKVLSTYLYKHVDVCLLNSTTFYSKASIKTSAITDINGDTYTRSTLA